MITQNKLNKCYSQGLFSPQGAQPYWKDRFFAFLQFFAVSDDRTQPAANSFGGDEALV